jgi:hypothetical protein
MSDTPKTPVVLSYGINDISVETDAELAERIASVERRALRAEAKLKVATEVCGWAQSLLTALNSDDLPSGSMLHLKLREVMIQYRAALDQIGKA